MANSIDHKRASANEVAIAHSAALRWSGILFAMVFPAIITWIYIDAADRYSPNTVKRPAARERQVVDTDAADRYSPNKVKSVFTAVKVIQFGFPVVWVLAVLREPLRTGRLSTAGLLLAAGFSVVIVGVGWTVFEFALRELPVFSKASELIYEKIGKFGINSVGKYALLAVFYSVVHSLLEEYYWRWFVFRQLRKLVPLWPAAVVSALAFMAHHVIVLNVFFQDMRWLAWLLSGAVAVGGVFWAWLYERTGSILAPWLSHALIDAGIFWIGYELIRGTLTGGS